MHWKHIGDWELDPRFWPDPEGGMVRELKTWAYAFMVSPWTLVDEKSKKLSRHEKGRLFTGSIDGKHDMVDFYGPNTSTILPILKQPNIYGINGKRINFDRGIHTFWLDPCDEFHAIQDYDKVTFHVGPALEAHSYFVTCHQRNIYNGLEICRRNEIVTHLPQRMAGQPALRRLHCASRHIFFLQSSERIYPGGPECHDERN